MGLDEITSKNTAGTDTTVVRALGTGETVLGPAEDLSIGVEESVLLLKTEPGLLSLGSVHHLLGVSTVVGLVRGAIVVVTLAEDEDVVATTEGVLEDGDRTLGMLATICGVKAAPRQNDLRGRHRSCRQGPGWWTSRRSSTRGGRRPTWGGRSRGSWSYNGDHRHRQSRRLNVASASDTIGRSIRVA